MSSELVAVEFSKMDSAIAASFEAHGRRGWLHTEVDRWLWDGKERRPADSRTLIERNRQEFQRYGELVDTVSTNPGPQGGRPALAYLRSFGQALLYCTLSEAPRAADVREALIRTFEKYTTGELVPTSSDAVVQSAAWDRLADAMAGLTVTVDRVSSNVDALTASVAQLTANMNSGFADLRQEVCSQGERIDALALRVGHMESRNRRDPKPGEVALMVRIVVTAYGGMCPCCEEKRIIGADGRKTELWTVDHTNGPWDNRSEHLWPVCRDCNQRLYSELGFRKQVQSEFAVFQKRFGKLRPHQMLLVM